MGFDVGDLVESEAFTGIGKLVSLDGLTETGTVAFFESPVRYECRQKDYKLDQLRTATIYDETNVYLEDDVRGVWRRARYGSEQPGGRHLVIFKQQESTSVPIGDIYVLNLAANCSLNPLGFLEARCTDTPYFSDLRIPFCQSYIEQRAACRSLSSILSSSVEIEPHQIAVVRRVLQDATPKYLLADEVGLGKTIEACLILREHVLQDEVGAHVVIGVPESLIEQWRSELIERFYLADLLDSTIFVCPHRKLAGALEIQQPTMLIIDEAHQISPWAWSGDSNETSHFHKIAKGARDSNACLLLSGTPLTGNERNFLSMLHLLSPHSYELTEEGMKRFLVRLEKRERLGGMYQALVPDNDNDTLTDLIDEISDLFEEDQQLQSLVRTTAPLVRWDKPEEGPERQSAIAKLRAYIGENYRLHQRMLRNRRNDPGIRDLFPGLAGEAKLTWAVDETALSVDQLLDAFRDQYFGSVDQPKAITQANFQNWVQAYFTSPLCIGTLACSETKRNKSLAKWETEALKDLIACSESEQLAKDEVLANALESLLIDREQARIVIFCDELSVADHVYSSTKATFGNRVERHVVGEPLRFGSDEDTRILVCDRRGEDGLNLHGGDKVVIHYALPISFAQIEQRNGRVNRYSAAISARPVPSLVILPDRSGLFETWVTLLSDVVGIFKDSVASLQYVLQDEMDRAWVCVIEEGAKPLNDLAQRLAGPDGLLAAETRRVEAQEELNSMNEEVELARQFAEELEEADEAAEAQAKRMFGWIGNALHFQKRPGPNPQTFRYRYVGEGGHGRRTLVDVMSFLEKCITGIDQEESSWGAPVTALMSSERQVASHGGQVYPMRFGQPFIDTIFDLSRSDSRGICSVRLRNVAGYGPREPAAYFQFNWILSGCDLDATPRETRIADGKITPRFVRHWIDEGGHLVADAALRSVLAARYCKELQPIGHGRSYQDINIGHDRWDQLEEHYPKTYWPSLTRKVGDASRHAIETQYDLDSDEIRATLESLIMIIIIGS